MHGAYRMTHSQTSRKRYLLGRTIELEDYGLTIDSYLSDRP